MEYADELIEELNANKAIFDSHFTPTERVDAFRRQSIILDKIAKLTPKPDKYALYKSHLKEYSQKKFKAFINDRSRNVEAIIRGVPRCPLTRTLKADEFVNNNPDAGKPTCSGKFRNCVRTEVLSDDLKMFQQILGCIPSENVLETASVISFMSENQSNVVSNDALSEKNVRINPVVQKNYYASNEPGFRTAREELILQNMKKLEPSTSLSSRNLFNYGASKKSLGARRNVRSGFVPPIRQQENTTSTTANMNAMETTTTEPINEHLQNIDPKMVELITNEIMHKFKPISWNDIAGLEYAKSTIKEAVVWPLLRPDIFTGLRRPPRGILLFGPPGTGKTLIGKCIASQSKSTFFSISASSLTSKWIGEGEKMVRALFAVAAVHQPSVIFIDEIDSLLSQRSETEHESSRRLKTEFLVQLDGANTTGEERILIVGATNRPRELDEAARRRLVRRLYIPLPELPARIQILTNLLQSVRNKLSPADIEKIGTLTDGYSGADMENLCREASMEPIRSIPPEDIPFFDEGSVRSVTLDDFEFALKRIRATVSPKDINQYVEWDKMYGAGQ